MNNSEEKLQCTESEQKEDNNKTKNKKVIIVSAILVVELLVIFIGIKIFSGTSKEKDYYDYK